MAWPWELGHSMGAEYGCDLWGRTEASLNRTTNRLNGHSCWKTSNHVLTETVTKYSATSFANFAEYFIE